MAGHGTAMGCPNIADGFSCFDDGRLIARAWHGI
jgi:hypothetical protein